MTWAPDSCCENRKTKDILSGKLLPVHLNHWNYLNDCIKRTFSWLHWLKHNGMQGCKMKCETQLMPKLHCLERAIKSECCQKTTDKFIILIFLNLSSTIQRMLHWLCLGLKQRTTISTRNEVQTSTGIHKDEEEGTNGVRVESQTYKLAAKHCRGGRVKLRPGRTRKTGKERNWRKEWWRRIQSWRLWKEEDGRETPKETKDKDGDGGRRRMRDQVWRENPQKQTRNGDKNGNQA